MYYDNMSKERKHLGAPRQSVTIVEDRSWNKGNLHYSIITLYS